MLVEFEYTDLFCGEVNYSWVKREKLFVSDDISDKQLRRLAKKTMGLSGVNGTWDYCGDAMRFTPYRLNTVLFITF
jgi:hypothetical protein